MFDAGFRFDGMNEPRPPVASPARGGDNHCMSRNAEREDDSSAAQTAARGPFLPGSMVVVTLGNPRDKFWGMILALAPEGLSMSGIELASFEDLVVMVKDGESVTPAVVFFPMHRIERIELDLPDGSLPSLSQRFSAKTGLDPSELLGLAEASGEISSHAGSRPAVRPTEDDPA
jgi:hypothetical protein